MELVGLTNKERKIVSIVAYFHGRNPPSKKLPEYSA